MSKNKTHIRHLVLATGIIVMYCGKTVKQTNKINSIFRNQVQHIENKNLICKTCLKKIFGTWYANHIE